MDQPWTIANNHDDHRKPPKTSPLVMCVVALTLITVSVTITPRSGAAVQPPAKATARDNPPNDGKKAPGNTEYYGSLFCKNCHNKNIQDATIDRAVSLQNEWTIFDAEDKHAQSYTTLQSALGAKMSKSLGYDVTQAAACLSCHGPIPTDKLDGPKVGVSCETCHGPANRKDKAWANAHTNSLPDIRWRNLNAEEKAGYGLTDLRSPRGQAKMCMSCHVGDPQRNRIVTHEMYAAGHPPLPGIESAHFGMCEPMHWRWLRDTPANQGKPESRIWEATQLSRIGAIVALTNHLDLMTHAAGTNTQTWPELATMDCLACHHPLQRPSWRQERGYRLAPGRIPPQEWPFALVNAVILTLPDDQRASMQTEYDRYVKALWQTFDDTPFGEAREVDLRAKTLRTWLNDRLLPAIENNPADPTTNRTYWNALCDLPENAWPGAESARQMIWTLQSLYGEYRRIANPKTPTSPKPDPNSNDSVNAVLRTWETQLKTMLTPGQQKPIADQVAGRIQAQDQFQPLDFVKAVRSLIGKGPGRN